MAAIAEALGMTLPGTAAIPAVHADRLRAAEATGARAVALARLGPDAGQDHHRRSRSRTRSACCWRSAARPTASSTWPRSPAGVGLKLDLERLNELSDTTPVLAAVKPVGDEFYMEDFFAAGGIGAVLRELKPLLHLDCMTVTGETLGERLAAEDERLRRPPRHQVGRPSPVEPQGGLVALFGSLAPDGAILKRSAATPALFETTARAVVFSSLDDLAARIDDPDARRDRRRLPRPAERRPAQRRRACRRPASCRSPRSCCAAGVKDMVRISDARMSGTAYGTIVLHVAPEAAVGGPLALVQDGRPHPPVGCKERRLDLLVDADELAIAAAAMQVPDAGRRDRAATTSLFRDIGAAGAGRLRLRLPAAGAMTSGANGAMKRRTCLPKEECGEQCHASD